MPAAAVATHTDDEVVTVGRLILQVVTGAVSGFLGHAIVRIVPVVSLLLNFTENVSPFANVSADP